jgi:Nucleotidyl transferase AbiEii toxin, Type IV TA system
VDAFLTMSMAERRFACLKAEAEKRLQAASVEKDFWVCWTLRELFGLPGLGSQMTFKGGTSLAKAWGLIDRFSEDIDIVVDKAALGFAGEASPDRAPSNKQRRKRLDDLIAACRLWVQGDLKSALEARIADRLGESQKRRLLVDPDADDGQCLLLEYPSAFPASEAGYVRPVVKIELGARSDDWPSEPRAVMPYVVEILPNAPERFARIATLAPERTFWEKALLLHEETFRPLDKPRRIRMARHYYDVWCLITRGVALRALEDAALFERVAAHREIFFRLGWVDYATLRRGSLRLTPPDQQRDAWRLDYEAMAESMFYGERPAFGEIMEVVGEFERRFNAGVGQ